MGEEHTTKRSKKAQLNYKSSLDKVERELELDEPIIDLSEGESKTRELFEDGIEKIKTKGLPWLKSGRKALSRGAKRLKTTPKKQLITGSVLVFAVLLTFGLIISYNGSRSDVLSDNINPDIEYDTLESVNDSVESTRVYNDELGIYNFTETIDSVPITVTQQALPDDLVNDEFGLEKLALSLTNKISINQLETDKGLMYVATNEDNTQTAIFANETILMFITAEKVISSQSWIDYIKSLE